ncbi:DUF4124 domain-containing protein [Guyparkeria sp.]|uniref:DUF4124 domain-containing protein n=1 Tax=Guyparkeria sp. TaxID=2035736 RepID=UPI00356783BF
MIFPTLRSVPATLGITGLCLLWTVPLSAAKVYQYTNSAGETVFTDEPTEGATVHEVESAPVIPMKPVETPEVLTADDLHRPEPAEPRGQPSQELSAGQPADVESAPAGDASGTAPGKSGQADKAESPEESEDPPGQYYDHFEIVDPANGEAASRLKGTITVELALQPALREGDRIWILLDGEPKVKDSGGRRHLVNGLTSGKHEITAQIRRDDEVIREAQPVRFTFHAPDQ